jgi:hypothetical protein
MSSCAIETCERSAQRGGPGCDMCDRVAMLPQPRTMETIRAKDKATRDGTPTLAAAKERRHPMWEKRRRDGPHRGNA